MTVTLDGLRLWQTQEAKTKSQSQPKVYSILEQESDETLLNGLERQEDINYSGIASGIRISQQAAYSDDPLDALAEWSADLMAKVNGNQGTGYTLDDDDRNTQRNVMLDSVSWQRNKGAPYELTWNVSGLWGDGRDASGGGGTPNVSPGGDYKIGGNVLDEVESVREERSQKIELYQLALADPGGNDILSKSGSKREITIKGSAIGDSSTRNTFNSNLLNLLGQDKIVEYEAAFPGRTLDVMVTFYESTRESGLTRKGEFMIQMMEGKNQ